MAALTAVSPDPVTLARESYNGVETYSVTLKSENKGGSEVLRYYYRRPGQIRMEFEKPYKGALLTYDPEEGKVRVRPFPNLKFLVFAFPPDNRMVKSSRGHRVDESDIGALLKAVEELKSKGRVEVLHNERVFGRDAIVVSVTGKDGSTADTDVNRYILWLDKSSYLPLKAEAYGVKGDLIERVLMDDLEVNVDW
ncbi:MAG: outer membrane lipoprotein-sorting protein [Deltaproteobacteria bacterium]|nr:outer membrane lipoprotein-sorting protein [Deltaproteobacteria bacterium]